ncbi:hypothetical protein ACFZDB_28075 [Streptomyces luteogriseus]|uniref:hypothetical protein n=1 Tax=Streptomyces luteogriseus TaxID=68233 RepID=UPI0036E84D27
MALTRSLACGDGRVPSARAERMARAVFGALGGVVEIGAVRAAGTWLLPDVSVGAFLEPRQGDVRRLLEGVRVVARFSGEVMAIADELGYFADHDVPAASLLLWSEGITGVPEPPERLEEPELVRRMCRIGADLQLTRLLQALVTAALAAGTEPGEGAAGIVEILRVACGLAEPGRAGVTSADPGRAGITPADVHRIWRVAHLPAILHPASDAPEWGKAGYRAYDAELERLL